MHSHTQWQNLLHLFSSVVEAATRHPGLETFQQATGRFQEVTQSIHGDPRLLSLLGKRRGQKGLREMQGEQLRKSLRTILSMLVSVHVCVCVCCVCVCVCACDYVGVYM